ncbi:MAG: extracellular solute-binding protein [Acholeplasmatales bacterium]|jgi:ABC-type glycerol-3-phosphate transport system substrate-binding protein|nr:extracellular solute-binding protein [Acholeplasmataceae bacterium]MCK9289540.1 extracellular solute-binding protein [Acholeplasmataceae bacterium]MCK9427592.1 extracellular solute-binding protein [Acholeplasmataceae bacterium]MDY0115430.1 extracellular solute-binding protein [Acholeplasmatales bacterium]
MKKTTILLISLITLLFIYVLVDSAILIFSTNSLKYNSEYENVNLEELKNSSREEYYYYLIDDKEDSTNKEVIEIDLESIVETVDFDKQIITNYEGKEKVISTPEYGEITWDFNVDNPGFYYLLVEYYPIVGKSSDIERTIKINGEIPFFGSENILFPRIWGNETEINQDIYGNDIRPTQVEKPNWVSHFFKDPVGYVAGNYQFYFREGLNTLTLVAEREPFLISSLKLVPVKELKSYQEISAEYDKLGYQKVEATKLLIEGENSSFTTSPTLYPENSNDPATSPNNSPKKVKLNTIGGNNWRIAGGMIAWDFTVSESGLYQITYRLKQNLATGMSAGRNIYINDEIPFKEMLNYSFKHSNGWRNQTLGTKDEPFYFYFEAGKNYQIKMETSLGQYGSRIASLESIINNLSSLYREIIKFTGPEPDVNRDFLLLKRIPNLINILTDELTNLEKVRSDLIALSGSKSEKTGILDTIIFQLKDFIKKPSDIHKKIKPFNDNISSLGTLVILLSAHPLEIDYFIIHGDDVKLPRARKDVFSSNFFKIRSFIATFFTDYSAMGMTYDNPNAEKIEVWITVGKDQANILRKLIDEQFSSKEGVRVDLKLVSGAALLPATLSGKGPDVALGVGYNVPVNYALRNAAYDISSFEDYDEIKAQFHESALVPFSYEDGVYALPEQQMFLMMFYRKDIFEEYGLKVPNTWDEVISSVVDLQNYNLEFYLPIPVSEGAVINLPPNPIFSTMFYQNDGEFYLNNNTESGFDEGLGPEVFERWTEFYTDYSFPVQADFVNRFRSGQMPIGITYYNLYNTLSVFAPEIRGKWSFTLVPGTVLKDENGTPIKDEFGEEIIRRETVSAVNGSMILAKTKNVDASWKFLKWWTSAETQLRFGREMEGILGAAARYPTANMEAMESLPWRVNEIEILKEQWKTVKGIPEVPGSYMTGRHLDNAFRLVINERANPRETIYDYVQIINEEIRKKREEFGD